MKISIITATFNSQDFILDALESYQCQNYTSKELIIVDGCSSDNTLKLIKSTNCKIDKLIIEEDNGIYSALNKGITHATGDVIGFLHSDDYYADPYVLSNVMDVFHNNHNLSAVYGNLDYVDCQNPSRIVRSWKSKAYHDNLLKQGWMPPHPSLFVSKSWYHHVGGFEEKYIISSDYDSILKFFSNQNFTSYFLNKTLMKMRTGGVSSSLKNISRKSYEDYLILKDHNSSIKQALLILLMKNLSKLSQFCAD